MSEQKLQAKILKWLEKNDHYVFKVVTANRAGVADIVGCTPIGHFFAIEVKFGHNKASKLQEWHLSEIRRLGGIAILAYSLEDVTSVLAV